MELTYTIIYSQRKTLGLSVERDRSVVVRAPHGTGEDVIKRAVEAKRLWIYTKVNHAQKYPVQARRKEFVSGEALLYLGRNYRLEITDEAVDGVQFHSGFRMARDDCSRAGQLLKAWYIERAHAKLPPRIAQFASALGVAYERVLVSEMRARWASCTPKNNLNFNWRIMRAPIPVIDYLIVHELAHLLEPNHTPRFWNIVAIQVPRYEAAKTWLRENGSALEEDF